MHAYEMTHELMLTAGMCTAATGEGCAEARSAAALHAEDGALL